MHASSGLRKPGPTAGDEDTRQRLLSAAGPVFARRGFDAATVREICGEAGVNVASIGYHFGDKLGLYLEVIRQVRARREQCFPLPEDGELPAEERLRGRIRLLLRRILSDQEESSWETQLMMREMHSPTAAFEEMVQEYFRPQYERLVEVLQVLTLETADLHVCRRLAFSIVGQCLYCRIGRETMRILIPESERHWQFDRETLVEHITAVTLAACRDSSVCRHHEPSEVET